MMRSTEKVPSNVILKYKHVIRTNEKHMIENDKLFERISEMSMAALPLSPPLPHCCRDGGGGRFLNKSPW